MVQLVEQLVLLAGSFISFGGQQVGQLVGVGANGGRAALLAAPEKQAVFTATRYTQVPSWASPRR